MLPTMVGAVLTHVTHAETRNIPLPLILLVLATVLAYLRRPERLSLRTPNKRARRPANSLRRGEDPQ